MAVQLEVAKMNPIIKSAKVSGVRRLGSEFGDRSNTGEREQAEVVQGDSGIGVETVGKKDSFSSSDDENKVSIALGHSSDKDWQKHALAVFQKEKLELDEKLSELEKENAELKEKIKGFEVQFDDQYKEFSEKGYSKGMERAAHEIEASIEESLEEIARLKIFFTQNKDAQLAKASEISVSIAMAALGKLVGDELMRDDFRKSLVSKAVENVREAVKIDVHVAPGDFSLFEKAGLDRVTNTKFGGLQFFPDPRVSAGGCIVETDRGSWDARIETQLRRLNEVLMEAATTQANSE